MSNENQMSQSVRISEKVILFRLNKSYKDSMGDADLYNACCGNWRTGERRNEPEFAFALYNDIVKEVYVIKSWIPAKNKSDDKEPLEDLTDKWEFQGTLADQSIRDKYFDKDVREYFKNSSRSFVYVNC